MALSVRLTTVVLCDTVVCKFDPVGVVEMDMLSMKFAAVPFLALIIIVAVSYGVTSALRRADAKKVEKFNAEHKWKPHKINGVDFGEWVRSEDTYK